MCRFWTQYVEQIPIPPASPVERAVLVGLVERVLAAKQAAPVADVSALELEIDQLVYKLYDLTA